jgi:hypothetical protein
MHFQAHCRGYPGEITQHAFCGPILVSGFPAADDGLWRANAV